MCEAYGSERFTGRAGYYEKGRPEYAADMIHDIVSGMQQEHQEKTAFAIADIGAGTGKFTKQLLEALGGTAFLIWNIRDMQTGFVQELCDIYKKYCPFFKGLSGGIERDDKRIGAFFTDGYTRKEYPNDITYTKESFIDRSLSASYSLRPQDELFQEYREELEKLFDSYADDGVAVMSNKTVVYSGKMGRE